METSQAPRRRRIARVALLLGGLALAVWLGARAPRAQHVRIILGAAASEVTAVGIAYVGADGELAREAHFTYPAGAAPRIVSHEPNLPDGDYRLDIDIDARDGRRAIQRQVTLGGGSTQIDVSNALVREGKPGP